MFIDCPRCQRAPAASTACRVGHVRALHCERAGSRRPPVPRWRESRFHRCCLRCTSRLVLGIVPVFVSVTVPPLPNTWLSRPPPAPPPPASGSPRLLIAFTLPATFSPHLQIPAERRTPTRHDVQRPPFKRRCPRSCLAARFAPLATLTSLPPAQIPHSTCSTHPVHHRPHSPPASRHCVNVAAVTCPPMPRRPATDHQLRQPEVRCHHRRPRSPAQRPLPV